MISHRLASIIDWIDASVLADVGCDHGYAAVEAVRQQKAEKAYAMDTAEGPLKNAKETISQYQMEETVFPILSNGLEHLPSDVDEILIAGMGGRLVIQILEQGKDKLAASIKLLLSVHKDAPLLRKYLLENGWTIVREKIIQEGQHFYPLLLAERGNSCASEEELELGIHPEISQEYIACLLHLKHKYKKILEHAEVKDLSRKLCMVEEKLHQLDMRDAE